MKKDEFKNLLPGETITLLSGERVEVRPVPFGKVPEFFEDVDALIKKFMQGGKLELLTNPKELMSLAFEETLRIVGKIIRKKRAWFNTIDIADGIAIVNVIVSQNIDNERAKKNLAELLERMKTLLPSQMPSSSSSAQDIASRILNGDIAPDKSALSETAS